jgi:RNA polymerase sigma-70 factor (ECF subfamily)
MAVYFQDKKLVKQLLAGDARAFDQFFGENFARLYRFALTRLSDDPDAAREVAQITLTRAIRKLHTYRAESALFTWLCAICRHYRRVELLRFIQVALDKLPARYGDVLEWKYIEGHSIKEISVRLNIGTEATQSLLARAKRAFADVYSSMTEGFERVESELVKS